MRQIITQMDGQRQAEAREPKFPLSNFRTSRPHRLRPTFPIGRELDLRREQRRLSRVSTLLTINYNSIGVWNNNVDLDVRPCTLWIGCGCAAATTMGLSWSAQPPQWPCRTVHARDRLQENCHPVTVQEGLFLYNHGLSPYDGGVFHQAPLLLPLFSLLPDPTRYPLVTVLLYTLVDLASAYALMQIFASGQSYTTRFFTSSRESKRWSSSAVAAAYLFNPFVILTCLARSTNVFGNLFILIATLKACRGALMGSAFALAIASYMSLHPLMLLPPLTILCYDSWVLRRNNNDQNTSATSLVSFAVRYTLVLVAAVAILFALSYALIGDWSFISAVYASRLLLPDLTPNVGLWWYFFIEIFDSFRNFFLGVFWLHMVSYSPALTIRLREQPLAAVVLLCGIFAIFQPYANVGDAGFWLSLLSMYGHVHEREYSSLLADHICFGVIG
jgi:phosphatidylinositol glycan class U